MRNDVHRPSAPEFDPEAYDWYGAFDNHPEEGDGSYRVQVVSSLTKQGYRFGAGSSGQCGHCGAMIRYGALMVRHDIKEFIFVGEQCLDNRFDLSKAEFKRLRESARLNRERAQKAERIAAVLAENPGLADALNADHYIAADIRAKFQQYGEISEKQIALVFKVAADAAERATREAERAATVEALAAAGVTCPVGRVEVSGVVLSVKWVDSAYGGALKMMVESDEGWRVWGSVPASLSDAERGDRVTFVASVEQSNNDALFGFFKRPAKGKVLAAA